MRRRVPLLATLALLLAGTEAAGQVTTLRNLAFGTITSGTTASVGKTSGNAAQWRIHVPVTLVGFQLTLPTSLTGPGLAIPVTFSSTDGVYRLNSNNPAGGTTFNPSGFQAVVAGLGSDVYVWLGASVSPPLNQTPGTYSATVVLTTTGLL
ncbi:MAG: hypothetical protein ACJ8DC_20055 [Gemmatimonadales bacterium]